MSSAALLYHVKFSDGVSIEALVAADTRVSQLLAHLTSECLLPPSNPPGCLYYQGRALKSDALVSRLPEKSTFVYSVSKETSCKDQIGVSDQVYQDLIEVNRYYPGLLVNAMPSLYVRVAINKVHVVCVVDTGAEFNSISYKMAQMCGLDGHIDTRYAGRAIGVGSTRMLGRIHICQVQCGGVFLPMNFAVLDTVCDTLIGMSALRMYRAQIDLASLKMSIGGADVPLLSNEEIEQYHMEQGT